jgi:hypothetical protein
MNRPVLDLAIADAGTSEKLFIAFRAKIPRAGRQARKKSIQAAPLVLNTLSKRQIGRLSRGKRPTKSRGKTPFELFIFHSR